MRHRPAPLPLAALLVAGAALVGCTAAREGLPVRVHSPSSASAEYGALARAGVFEMDTRRR